MDLIVKILGASASICFGVAIFLFAKFFKGYLDLVLNKLMSKKEDTELCSSTINQKKMVENSVIEETLFSSSGKTSKEVLENIEALMKLNLWYEDTLKLLKEDGKD